MEAKLPLLAVASAHIGLISADDRWRVELFFEFLFDFIFVPRGGEFLGLHLRGEGFF